MKRFHRISPATRCTRRRGTSLVETLVVITVAAAMTGLAVTAIHRLLGAEREATRQVRYAASVARLSRALRDDVHVARDVDLPAIDPGKPPALVAALPGGRQVRYELDGDRATRVETGAADHTHRDTFYFPPHSRLEFDRTGERGLVRLTIAMPAGAPAAKPKESSVSVQATHLLTIEAAPSRTGNRGADAGDQRTNNEQLNTQEKETDKADKGEKN